MQLTAQLGRCLIEVDILPCFTVVYTLSESENILCSIPQGPILGTLLFLPLEINNVLTDLYKECTTLCLIDRSQACIEQQLQNTMRKL